MTNERANGSMNDCVMDRIYEWTKWMNGRKNEKLIE